MSDSNINNILSGLSDTERELVLGALKDVTVGKNVLGSLYALDYRQTPPTPEEFMSDPNLGGLIGKDIYPEWRKNFINLYQNPDVYYIISTGAIGIGKDFFTEYCVFYELCKIGCLRNPHEFYRRALNTDIVISVISITKAQTKNVFFNQLKSMIDTSPWFEKNFPRNKDKNDIIEFFSPADDNTGKMGKIRVMYGAPNNAAVIGENVLIAIIDEANFMQITAKSKKERGVNKDYDQAKKVHDNLIRRMKSRFLQDGRIAGKLFLLSSRQYPDDFVERKIAERKNDKNTVIYEYAIYDIKPWDYYKMTPKTFKVLIGTAAFPSKILAEDETPPTLDAQIEEVPMELYDDYIRDLDGSIRDYSGIATLNVQTFLKQYDKLYAGINPEIPQIFTSPLTNFEDGEHFIYKVIDKIDKSAPRAIHLDLSSSGDSTGFAMVHCAGMKEITKTIRTVDDDGIVVMRKSSEQVPVYRADIILEIKAPPQKEIIYANIRQLIMELRDLGYNIAGISADRYQSKDTLQILSDNGFETFYLSVDTSLEPYYNLKQAIYDGRFEFAHHEKFELEMVNLEEDTKKKKIDHRQNYCFTGDVKIKMLDGTYISFEDLAKSEKKQFWVYSCKSDGEIVPALATNCRITNYITELIEVTLDNDHVIKCTPEHPFMLRNGEYKYAKDLTDKDSLMPLHYFTYRGKNKSLHGYEMIRDNKKNKVMFTHTMVSNFFGLFASFVNKTIIHHYDINKRNNTPNNLKLMTIADHTRLHAFLSGLGKKNIEKRIESFKKSFWTNPKNIERKKRKESEKIEAQERGIKNKDKFREIQQSEEGRKRSSAWIKILNKTYWTKEKHTQKDISAFKQSVRALWQKQDNEAYEKIKPYLPYIFTHTQAMRLFGNGYKTWLRRFEKYDIDTVSNFRRVAELYDMGILKLENIGLTKGTYKKYLKTFNHKIKSIKIIKAEKPIPVYDIEVPIYDNFALEAGVFVHNSKDLSDAIAGACWTLTQNSLQGSSNIEPTLGLVSRMEREKTPEQDCEEFEGDFMEAVLGMDDKTSAEQILNRKILTDAGII